MLGAEGREKAEDGYFPIVRLIGRRDKRRRYLVDRQDDRLFIFEKELAHRNQRIARRDLQLSGDSLWRRLHVNAQDSRRGGVAVGLQNRFVRPDLFEARLDLQPRLVDKGARAL